MTVIFDSLHRAVIPGKGEGAYRFVVFRAAACEAAESSQQKPAE